MTLYEINGDARDTASWKNKRIRFYEEQVIYENNYTVNQLIYFSAGKNFVPYIGEGWSSPEPEHMWTEGKNSEINIYLQSPPRGNLIFKIKGFGIAPADKRFQNLTIHINGILIGNLSVHDDSEYWLPLPRNILTEGENRISISIQNPVAPCKNQTKSDDCRLLGFAMKEFSIANPPASGGAGK
jgi:hypothetical protein